MYLVEKGRDSELRKSVEISRTKICPYNDTTCTTLEKLITILCDIVLCVLSVWQSSHQ